MRSSAPHLSKVEFLLQCFTLWIGYHLNGLLCFEYFSCRTEGSRTAVALAKLVRTRRRTSSFGFVFPFLTLWLYLLQGDAAEGDHGFD